MAHGVMRCGNQRRACMVSAGQFTSTVIVGGATSFTGTETRKRLKSGVQPKAKGTTSLENLKRRLGVPDLKMGSVTTGTDQTVPSALKITISRPVLDQRAMEDSQSEIRCVALPPGKDSTWICVIPVSSLT